MGDSPPPAVHSGHRRRRRNSSLATRVHSHVKMDGQSELIGLPSVERPGSSTMAVVPSVASVQIPSVKSAFTLVRPDQHSPEVNSKEDILSHRSMGDGKDSSMSESTEVAAVAPDNGERMAAGGGIASRILDREVDEQYTMHHEQHLFGPGGSILFGRNEVRALLPNETATILCVTWNLAGKTPKTADSLRSLFHPADVQSPDIYCISFQELASTNMCFHRDIVTLIVVAIGDGHVPFCWVRKWSQMVLVLVRKALLPFISDPEWQFVPSSVWAKPVRTKGAIAVCFRLFHAAVLVVGCHLSYGPQMNRVSDYKKISQSLRFDKITKSTEPAIRSADAVIWFGDLNFRITDQIAMNALLVTQPTATGALEGRKDSAWTNVLINDQLSLDMSAGNIFEKFKEAPIRFAPTHKLIVGTHDYNPRRVPSYTDRVLYRNNTGSESTIVPLVYHSVWSETRSDHKPVYAAFLVRVIKEQRD